MRSSFLISMNPPLFWSVTFLDQLITKSTLTTLCQLTSRVGGSFVYKFFCSLLHDIFASNFFRFWNSSVEEHHLIEYNVAGSSPHFSFLFFSYVSLVMVTNNYYLLT